MALVDDAGIPALTEAIPELRHYKTGSGLPFRSAKLPSLRLCVHTGVDREPSILNYRSVLLYTPPISPLDGVNGQVRSVTFGWMGDGSSLGAGYVSQYSIVGPLSERLRHCGDGETPLFIGTRVRTTAQRSKRWICLCAVLTFAINFYSVLFFSLHFVYSDQGNHAALHQFFGGQRRLAAEGRHPFPRRRGAICRLADYLRYPGQELH